jgi:hypothetical protein
VTSDLLVPFANPASVERVAIRSGLAEGNNQRTLQARPRRIELSFSDGTCLPYQLANSPGEQRIRVKATGVDQVRLTIIDVYPPEDGGAPGRRAERGAVRKPGMHRAGVQRLQSSVGNRAVAQLVGETADAPEARMRGRPAPSQARCLVLSPRRDRPMASRPRSSRWPMPPSLSCVDR